MSDRTVSAARRILNPRAAILAWVLPGLGHAAIGERDRGLRIGAGVVGLFLAGILIGGLGVVDRSDLWFYAQVGAGPLAFAADWLNAALLKSGVAAPLIEAPMGPPASSLRAVAHPHEFGTLYCAMAGLMNMVAVLDVLSRREGSR
jgi:hypothetical protein